MYKRQSQVGQAVAAHLTRRLGHVDGLPVDRRRGVLHEQPGAAAGHAAGEIGVEGQADVVARVGRHQVVVHGDDVGVPGEGVPVDLLLEGAEQVGGDRDAGGGLAQQRALRPVPGEQGVGGEAAVVEFLAGVAEGGGVAGWVDLLPVAVALPPEVGAPDVVDPVQRRVAVAQPGTEGLAAGVAVAEGVVVAPLVVHVPHDDGRMVRVPSRQFPDDGVGRPGVVRTAGAERLPAAVGQPGARRGQRERAGVGLAEPGRRGGGGGGEVDGDAGGVQQVEDLVEQRPVVRARAGFEAGPGEHSDGDEVDPRLAHEAYVLVPDVLGPLLRVVVAPVGDCADPVREGEHRVVHDFTAPAARPARQ